MMTDTTDAPVSSLALGLRLDPNKVLLYKFYLNRRDLVPAGIREIPRPSNKAMDDAHAQEAIARGDEHAAMDSILRPGRRDTGKAIYQNAKYTQIGSIRSMLAPKSYRLTDVHFFEQKGYGKKPRDQWIVVAALDTQGDSFRLSPETVDGLRKLALESTYTANVFDNFKDQTLNFTERQPGQKPKAKLVVRKGFLQILDLEEGKDVASIEREEDLMSAKEIEDLLASFKRQM